MGVLDGETDEGVGGGGVGVGVIMGVGVKGGVGDEEGGGDGRRGVGAGRLGFTHRIKITRPIPLISVRA